MAPDFAALSEARDAVTPEVVTALDAFVGRAGGSWDAHVDRRSGQFGSITGSGQPWIPGGGNTLRLDDVRELLDGKTAPDLETLEARARLAAPAW